MILPPVKPCKYTTYFVIECKECKWKKLYNTDSILIREKCPKCGSEDLRLRKAKLKEILNPIEIIKSRFP